jgi:hypothetical protein
MVRANACRRTVTRSGKGNMEWGRTKEAPAADTTIRLRHRAMKFGRGMRLVAKTRRRFEGDPSRQLVKSWMRTLRQPEFRLKPR